MSSTDLKPPASPRRPASTRKRGEQVEAGPTDIDGVSFDEIHELFANSSYGKILRQRVRYGPYKPKELSDEEWIRILGPDVNNLEHLKTSLAVAQDFIHRARDPHPEWQSKGEEIRFTPGEEKLLCLTAVIHDWGEAVVGDILWHRKTEKDGEKELEILKGLIEELVRYKFTDSLVDKMHLAADIAFGKNEKLSPAFNAIEHIGYGNNTLRMWGEKLNYDGLLSKTLTGLAKQLTTHHYPTWQEYAGTYPASHYWLSRHKKIFQEIKAADINWEDPILVNN